MGTDLVTYRRKIGWFSGGDPSRQQKLPKMATLRIPFINCHMSLAIKLCLVGLLVVAGNVERNPGPPKTRSTDTISKEDISELHVKLDAILEDTKVMKNNFGLLQTRVDNIEEDITDLKAHLQEDSERITELEKRKSAAHECTGYADGPGINDDISLKLAMDDMRKAINEIKKEKDDLENRSRRNNLVFFGVPQDRVNESWEESEEKINSVLENQLQQSDKISFDRTRPSHHKRAFCSWLQTYRRKVRKLQRQGASSPQCVQVKEQ